ncbi:MAG: C4-dicarboxylate ABC transporter [Treponema sp. RIFOXYC1_FULL_61_9]|nr:MAG: C4-dicarboxylate ABC transporter [Treponema sp. GWA1_62_8]OHE63969.1 MAG: C4-dicarboxylate ABC transporter [Treponema sp. GWC1_61_84]OHE69283.1 MAG: C4-dicarboxylate ABC transporter [Treponema sp. RIFOXYC1_FULL_61_9]
MSAADLLASIDRESAFRRLAGTAAIIVSAIAIIFTLFQLYTASIGLLPARIQRAVHLGFVLVLAYLLYPARRGKGGKGIPAHDIVLALLSACVVGYLVVNARALIERSGAYTQTDFVVGIIGILLVLEACRRVVGLPILTIALIFIAYAWLGPYMPGFLAHRGYKPQRIVSHLFFTTEGVLGVPLGVSATFIFLFILFGAFLEKTGIGMFFIDLANAVAGGYAGGPAKVAVITSALEGTISGSSVSNTVGSGSFTIPMMKRLGYKPEFAAAVEAAASTGGQIMPPIMGAAAFLMAETLGIPYLDVAKAAIIPALLYFTGIFISVHLEAKKLGLKGMPRDTIPRLGAVMKEKGHLIIPLIAIVYFLAEGSTPMRAALWGIVFSVVASVLRKSTRMSFKDFVNALEQAGRGVIGVAIACAVAGIIVGVVTLTGLGLKMASGLVDLAGGVKILTLFFTMIASLVLGMGVPTTANYLITATITAPAVVALGVPALAAHMFTFYFGIVADITPPVALAAYAGAAIAKSDPFKTGVTATRLAIGAFIIPYIFVFNPVMLLIGATPLLVVQMIATSLIGMAAICVSTEGWLLGRSNPLERLVFFAGGLLMIDPRGATDIAGLALLAVPVAFQLMRWRKSRTA